MIRPARAGATLSPMGSDGTRRQSAQSGVGDALGGAAIYPVRVVARAWRNRLETAAEDVIAAPETTRIIDRALAGPLPEELVESLIRHNVVDRIVAELERAGELDRMLDRMLGSAAMTRALERAMNGPELRAAIGTQSSGLAQQVGDSVRETAAKLDGRPSEFAGVVSRGAALVVDALAVATVTFLAGAAAALVGALAGGIRPHWLAGLLLGAGGILVAVGYFTLFWSTAGQTPGMRLFGVRVDPTPSLSRALVRTIGLALAIIPCFLGFVTVFFDARRRVLPDYLAGTTVSYAASARATPPQASPSPSARA